MGRTSGRTADETRRLALSAAARVIRQHGAAAPLDLIADEAGLSKGGVVYHFASKDQLLSALAQEQFDAFRAEVEAQLAHDDTGPGRLVRAYIRASLVPQDAEELRERFALITQLLTVPSVLELARQDDLRWSEDLERDGVPEPVRVLVLAAADGFGGAPLWATEHPERVRQRLQHDLIALVDRAIERR
ncbi:TetR family transcriptional regulator [Leucobacter weissii]|uniref:TetR family transcriptional regulator n=1 Tax=Leucobacter weissii TaxID=1983706 RepID=A0A939MIT6_9MICO|nr:TetR/AcrR family transcriptional regulator [Leucobacter weissii]MBO1901025.1 TetR family transcriptional regulator [Leucobacter weissii]